MGVIEMRYFLGLDIGSVSVKIALIDENSIIVHLDAQKITSGPREATKDLLHKLSEIVRLENIVSAGVSGSGQGVIPKELNWTQYSSPLAIIAGLIQSNPDAKTVIQIGGQTSLVIGIQDGIKKPWKVASNPLCAAGTGRFLEQQAYRLGISLEDFSRLALQADGEAPRIAARCSVFAKSDLIHMQQKGVSVESMLRSLSDSVARMVASFTKDVFEEPIYLLGGVAANTAIQRSLNEVLSERNGHPTQVIVPAHYLYYEALGSAFLSQKSPNQSMIAIPEEEETRERYFSMPKLEMVSQVNSWMQPQITKPFKAYLGVDIGSTSTKAVILNETGDVVAKHYLMTAGRPLDAIKDVFRNLTGIAGYAQIAGVGITGSGRYLVGSFIGADLVKNEITAQTRAAEALDPEADIIEIGGQDSKLVIKRNGVVIDYQMNKSCAAGTGSFIDELAEMLDVSVKDGQFADLAFQAPYTIDLGSRCAAFMGQAIASAQQECTPLETIIASLSNSIAGNYLSKVVENRKLGDKVILTGAVFYNDAVVSAFKQALGDRTIIVPEHKEVTGAIGVAILAKEHVQEDQRSKFKGFKNVVEADYELKTFTCHRCDNNCTISRLQLPGESATFYGSRCDFYDSTVSHEKRYTAFDERERLLFHQYTEGCGIKPKVGIPRALMTYDYAPLLLAFLNTLGAKAILSPKTNKQIIEESAKLSYPDSCFPIKLLHGHAESLQDADYILSPCPLRLGRQEGEENQKYACPLVQASPFLIRQALNLSEKILIPFIDLSVSDNDVLDSFTKTAINMGFDKHEGKEAALAGLAAQRNFERAREEYGRQLLQQIHENNQIGVVIFARAYMAQDSGANLGIADKLSQLGVVPIPLDFLPLSSVNPQDYSDRPYWMYESKQIAGAAITVSDPHLYGLVLTNFGCGPNSFILNIVEDIMGDKPLGQLEIDEHAAEAGIVTRLEAFVDTINNFSQSTKSKGVLTKNKDIYRTVATLGRPKSLLLVPRMAPHAEVLAAAMQANGVQAIVLPQANEFNLLYSNRITSGKECLPYRVTLGDFMRFFYENDGNGVDLNSVEGFMPGAYGPCRFGKYVLEQPRLLRDIGFDLSLRTIMSNNAYRESGLGTGFERLAWRGIVAIDHLQRLLWRTRPYEKTPGSADALFDELLAMIAEHTRKNESYGHVLANAVPQFKKLIDLTEPRRPLVGINGEIFLRSNSFSNNDLVKVCETAGLEIIVSPFAEWMNYVTLRNIEDGFKDRNWKKILKGYIRKAVQHKDERSVLRKFKPFIDIKEPSVQDLLSYSEELLSPKCGSEAVLSLGSGIEWLENRAFAGVISVMPHGCMPGGIVAAMSEGLSSTYGKPWISLTYDGFMETNNLAKINSFAEILRFCSNGHGIPH